MPDRDEIEIRPARSDDHPGIVALAAAALGWQPDDPNDALFRWKHVDNVFGPSPMWVAVHDGELVAFRAMLRWEFEPPGGGAVVRAVRAVDTATRPDHQGRGLFRRLTLHAVDELTGDGVAFVFNTPNTQSRPGYRKMGWQDVGRVPVAVAPRSPASLVRMLRARVPAGKWSVPTDVGDAAADVLRADDGIGALLASQPRATGLQTRRSLEFLRWRYADGPVAYRALLRTARIEDGLVLFRLRTRGAATEATISDLLVPGGDRRLMRALLARVRIEAQPDYLIRVQTPVVTRAAIRLPAQGPRLTWRGLTRSDCPPLAAWDLQLGDIELF